MKSLFILIASVLALAWSGSAYACPEGQYEACFIKCVCVPNFQTGLGAINPFPDTLKTIGGVFKGDIRQITEGVGGLVIKSSCPACSIIGHTIINEKDRQFVEQIVGRGWLVFLGTGNPTLVVVDATQNIITEKLLKQPAPLPIPVGGPASRAKMYYKVASADCLVLNEDGQTAGGWAGPIQMTSATGTYTYPQVDLAPGDILELSSKNESCPKLPEKQHYLASGKMVFSYSGMNTSPVQTAMKTFLIGTATQ